jgi:hypothetical protein
MCLLFTVRHKALQLTLKLLLLLLLLWLYSPLLGLGRLFQFLSPVHNRPRLLGQGISLSQGPYIHTEQHKYRTKAQNTAIHALSGIQTHEPSFQAREDSSCLRRAATVISTLKLT